MKLKQGKIYSNNSYFGIPTYYDNEIDIYYCRPKNKEFISKFYEKQYWDDFSRNKKYFSFGKFQRNLFIKLNINLLKYISDFQIIKNFIDIKNHTILEIGVGFGSNIRYLYRKGINIKGVEIDNQNTISINNDLKKDVVIKGNYEEININGKFDIIYLRHVFEHFYDLDNVIEKLKTNLNENGIIYINVPNASSKYFLEKSINNEPHIYHLTKMSLSSLFEKKGFKILHINTYNFISNNKIIEIIKSILYIGNLKIDNKEKSEFLIGIFKK